MIKDMNGVITGLGDWIIFAVGGQIRQGEIVKILEERKAKTWRSPEMVDSTWVYVSQGPTRHCSRIRGDKRFIRMERGAVV